VILAGPKVTTPSASSHDLFADRSMHASTPASQGTPAGGGGASFTIVSFAAAVFGSGGIGTDGTVVRVVDVVTGGVVGAGAAVGVLAHADTSPKLAIARPANTLVRMW
jgi:hypothetical protein